MKARWSVPRAEQRVAPLFDRAPVGCRAPASAVCSGLAVGGPQIYDEELAEPAHKRSQAAGVARRVDGIAELRPPWPAAGLTRAVAHAPPPMGQAQPEPQSVLRPVAEQVRA